jgi:hypothetical protein
MLRIILLGFMGILVLSFSGVVSIPEEVITRLVEEFGQNLKHVSLLDQAEVEESMRQHYGDYVVPELLEEWIRCPRNAPGRTVSSPWPDRIEVTRIRQVARNTYQVDGEIVEVTSTGEADRRAVSLVVEKISGTWRIRTLLLLPPGKLTDRGGFCLPIFSMFHYN